MYGNYEAFFLSLPPYLPGINEVGGCARSALTSISATLPYRSAYFGPKGVTT